jgi:hypothetical protein
VVREYVSQGKIRIKNTRTSQVGQQQQQQQQQQHIPNDCRFMQYRKHTVIYIVQSRVDWDIYNSYRILSNSLLALKITIYEKIHFKANIFQTGMQHEN